MEVIVNDLILNCVLSVQATAHGWCTLRDGLQVLCFLLLNLYIYIVALSVSCISEFYSDWITKYLCELFERFPLCLWKVEIHNDNAHYGQTHEDQEVTPLEHIKSVYVTF